MQKPRFGGKFQPVNFTVFLYSHKFTLKIYLEGYLHVFTCIYMTFTKIYRRYLQGNKYLQTFLCVFFSFTVNFLQKNLLSQIYIKNLFTGFQLCIYWALFIRPSFIGFLYRFIYWWEYSLLVYLLVFIFEKFTGLRHQ